MNDIYETMDLQIPDDLDLGSIIEGDIIGTINGINIIFTPIACAATKVIVAGAKPRCTSFQNNDVDITVDDRFLKMFKDDSPAWSFILAHEVGHIVNGDVSRISTIVRNNAMRLRTLGRELTPQEANADLYAQEKLNLTTSEINRVMGDMKDAIAQYYDKATSDINKIAIPENKVDSVLGLIKQGHEASLKEVDMREENLYKYNERGVK